MLKHQVNQDLLLFQGLGSTSTSTEKSLGSGDSVTVAGESSSTTLEAETELDSMDSTLDTLTTGAAGTTATAPETSYSGSGAIMSTDDILVPLLTLLVSLMI
ncbi:unnamed protein product [Cyberlindnera jadinii]|uniref:Uncharacterized protein n=1 Tax=Cyberlindnera jadinii (strain ATCC 18201 / CBS 1600 / BCRC 20928 / JCM 3617 / NBRC 0987 / NRRL Y-1542) TaxID=983966 RepID=A0A0H5CI79_CYBJN|nr:unnamed protein product [Cyberlindnera jadinii]